jgi:ADP-ribose pyrophosphatase YjhB (NUDIX family)
MSEKKPRVGSAVLVKHGDKFLLGKRNKKNANGLWVIPGGGIDWGETALNAGKREIKEETNLDIDIKRFLCVKEIIATHADYHTVVFFHLAEPSDPDQLRSSDDVSEVGFFTVPEIKEMNTVQSVADVLKEAGYWE